MTSFVKLLEKKSLDCWQRHICYHIRRGHAKATRRSLSSGGGRAVRLCVGAVVVFFDPSKEENLFVKCRVSRIKFACSSVI